MLNSLTKFIMKIAYFSLTKCTLEHDNKNHTMTYDNMIKFFEDNYLDENYRKLNFYFNYSLLSKNDKQNVKNLLINFVEDQNLYLIEEFFDKKNENDIKKIKDIEFVKCTFTKENVVQQIIESRIAKLSAKLENIELPYVFSEEFKTIFKDKNIEVKKYISDYMHSFIAQNENLQYSFYLYKYIFDKFYNPKDKISIDDHEFIKNLHAELLCFVVDEFKVKLNNFIFETFNCLQKDIKELYADDIFTANIPNLNFDDPLLEGFGDKIFLNENFRALYKNLLEICESFLINLNLFEKQYEFQYRNDLNINKLNFTKALKSNEKDMKFLSVDELKKIFQFTNLSKISFINFFINSIFYAILETRKKEFKNLKNDTEIIETMKKYVRIYVKNNSGSFFYIYSNFMIKSEQNFFYSHIYQSIIKTNQLTFQDIFNTDFMDKINNDYTLKLDSINILKMLPKIAFEFLISENDKDSYIKKLKNLDFFEKELSPFFAMLCGLESIKSIFNEKLAIRLVIRSKEKINKYLNEYEKASRAEVDSVDFIDCFVPIFSSFKTFIESVNKEFEIIIEKYKSYVKNTIQINELFLKDYNESKKENVNYLMFEPALMNKYYDLKNIFFESLISYLNNKDLASLNNLSNTIIIADKEYKQFNDNRFTISYKSFNEYFKSKLLDAMLKTRKIFLDRLKKPNNIFL